MAATGIFLKGQNPPSNFVREICLRSRSEKSEVTTAIYVFIQVFYECCAFLGLLGPEGEDTMTLRSVKKLPPS